MKRFDVARIKAQQDCREVAGRLLGPPSRVYYNYSMWRCPVHQDREPSLSVMADRVKCHACHWGGDVFELVMRVAFGQMERNEAFLEACRWLGGEADEVADQEWRPPKVEPPPTHKHLEPPCQEFQAALEEVAALGAANILKPGADGLHYLVGTRGLTPDTIRELGIGFLDLETGPTGLAAQRLAEGLGLRLSFKRGLLFPWRAAGALYGIRVRRFGTNVSKSWRYTQVTSVPERRVPGFGPALGAGLYLADQVRRGLPGLLIEGEINAITIWQEARDLVNAFSLGSAPELMDSRWFMTLGRCSRLLAVYDQDEAGDVGRSHARSLSERIQLVPSLGAKDANALHVDEVGQVRSGQVRRWAAGVVQTRGDWPKGEPESLT